MIQSIIAAQSSAPVMGGPVAYNNNGYRGPNQQPLQQHPSAYGQYQANQQQYSAEWAGYHAAQAAAQLQQQQLQQQQYSAAVAAQQQQQATVAQPAADTYYEQFFRYAYYYGEDAARAYYGAWSPPVGTPNPYGVNHAGIQPAPVATDPGPAAAVATAAPVAVAADSVVVAVAAAPAAVEARETGRRKVSNLPAWMTKT
jgi:far upstream element-binding protein